MGICYDIVFDCPRCENIVRYVTRLSDADKKLEDIDEGIVMDEMLEENVPNGHCWCESCGVQIGFVKKIKTYLEPVEFDKLPKDPTPEEIARVQAYLARQEKG
ncbi:hypothetical protein [Burkholderia phage FLC9]|nr:hypothetical protein [Burkholderia phage FLC9]